MPEPRIRTGPQNGCEHHDDCDDCPFSTCYEGRRPPPPNPRRRAKSLSRLGRTPEQIADELRVSSRQVYRYLRPLSAKTRQS